MDTIIVIGSFIATLLLIEGGYAVWRTRRDPAQKRVRRRLMAASALETGDEAGGITRRRLLSEVPSLNRMLLNMERTRRMNAFLEQAGIRKPLGFFILLTLVLAGLGFTVGLWWSSGYVAAPAAVILGAFPYLFILSKKRRRMRKFERQLPEALDMMARALKAGQAFTGALNMVAEEMDDPIGAEFGKTLGEINFGIDVAEALKNLSSRVACPDLRFFVVSVIMQRETGGNMAEIMENIAYLIRERFKLHGRIRVLAAEAKTSAIILVALPFLIAAVLALVNRDYLRVLVNDRIGLFMVGFALAMMTIGILIMKRMVTIKV